VALQEALITITGQVQGVGFRAWAQRVAVTLGIKGYVRNTDDSVEIVAQAEKAALDAFIAKCKAGPAYAKVEKVRVEKRPLMQRYDGFSMRGSEGFASFA
jgi:acylphosphatase